MLIPVILAGGTGSRLWPLSREAYPKPFISLCGEHNLFQQTLARVRELPSCQKTMVVCQEGHRFLIAEQLRQSGKPADIFLEPIGRNTAPATALAALQAVAQYEDAMLLVLPADHVITDTKAFLEAVFQAQKAAQHGHLVTFGVNPTSSETGYGYILAGAPLFEAAVEDKAALSALKVDAFIEKPSKEKAEHFVSSGNYYWNSGMFLFKASSYLDALKKFSPDIYEAMVASYRDVTVDTDFIRPGKAFEHCPKDSIDYAVMEKTKDCAMVPLQTPWFDLGSWQALAEMVSKDENGNTLKGDVIAQKTQNCYIHATKRLVATNDIADLVIVETGDAVLVSHKTASQEVKQLVDKLKEGTRKELTFHQRVHRPWGAFESIDSGKQFQVKHITVTVGASLSLQLHHHRSEHWVVVKGKASVTRGDENFTLTKDQSTYIPKGVKHRLENIGDIPLEIIEVQSGTYFGEDDIVRFDDNYGRATHFDAT